ncbi:MAG: DUF859 family phage minor structural protein [Tenuifilaceae bacterium]|nr:DUF859 family phage minor structural protein [Tenuifilaceae bacterium]
MASYGIILGTCSNREANYDAKLYWKQVSQNIANNTTTIRVWSVIENNGSSYNWSGTLSNWRLTVNGATRTRATTTSDSDTSWTWPSGWTDSETGVVITTYRTECIPEPVLYEEFTIPHNSDGTKTVTFSHSYSLLSGGAGPGNVSISGTMVLNTIARASSISSFTMPTALTPNTANSISFTLTTYSSFTHDISLKIGSTTIKSWLGSTVTTGTLPLTASEVNTLLANMPTAMSATITLIVQTKSGSTNIGSAVFKTTTCTISPEVKPNIPTITASQAISMPAGISVFVKGKSKILFSIGNIGMPLNSGTSIKSCVLTYLGSNFTCLLSDPIGSASYTTPYLTWSGTQNFTITITDNRNQINTNIISITAYDYSAPIITLSGTRSGSTITLSRAASTTYTLNNQNTITLRLYKRAVGAAWAELDTYALTDSNSSPLSVSASNVAFTGHIATISYEYKCEVTDKFETIASPTLLFPATTVEAALSIGTKSVAIGKFVDTGETYTLDVSGDTSLDGDLVITGDLNVSSFPSNTKEALVDLIYPVGSIYITTSTASPATLFPGTSWQTYGNGRVLVGYNPTDTLFNTIGKTGGSKDAIIVSHKHKQKMNSADTGLGSHTWHTGVPDDGVSKYGAFPADVTATTSTRSYVYTETVGASGTNANIQPYIVVNMWERTS